MNKLPSRANTIAEIGKTAMVFAPPGEINPSQLALKIDRLRRDLIGLERLLEAQGKVIDALSVELDIIGDVAMELHRRYGKKKSKPGRTVS